LKSAVSISFCRPCSTRLTATAASERHANAAVEVAVDEAEAAAGVLSDADDANGECNSGVWLLAPVGARSMAAWVRGQGERWEL
jgi:hypothetical protein